MASRAARIVRRRRIAGRTRGPISNDRRWPALGLILGGLCLALVMLVGATGLVVTGVVGALSRDLPDPTQLDGLTFSQPTVVYDRTGKVVLATFQEEERRVVAFDEIPRLILDATTAAEDRTFWSNQGFDSAAILSAIAQNASGSSERGASTITQQLVRARLLPSEVTGPTADRYLRKAKEIIQAIRVTQAFPGEAGKDRIIAAYLNEIFYGHGSYGIAAAAKVYFGVSDLARLTPAQAALLAGLPKSPTTLDPYRYAKPDAKGRLVVPPDSPPAIRRNWVLTGLATSARWTRLDPGQLEAALAEPIVLAGAGTQTVRAGHFDLQVRRELDRILGDPKAADTGGYTVITTLDWHAQQLAEKWMTAAAIVPNLSNSAMESWLDKLHVGAADRAWIRGLRGKDIHDGALVALDYRTGDVLAYVGSAGFGRDRLASAQFAPKFDAAGDGLRQPGSAFKPIVYATAFDRHRLTPGSLLLDVATQFDPAQHWAPHDADQLERGPVLVRGALQYSLNIPAIRALQRVGNAAVAATATRLGIRFEGGRTAFLRAGLAGAIGTVEVRPLDLTSAFGALANGGLHVPPRTILKVLGPDGHVVWQAPQPTGTQAVSAQAAFLVTDILAGNTDPAQNPIWAKALELRNTGDGRRRPAAVKTGTSNEAADLSTYGFLAPPNAASRHGLVVGVWMGNSDHSNPQAKTPAISLTSAAPLWQAFVRDYSRGWPVTDFTPPPGVVQATNDAWSGGQPGPWTRERTTAWFIDGTQPGAPGAVDPDGLLYVRSCGAYRVDLVHAELGPTAWDSDVANWMARARRGIGVKGPYDTRTAVFWGKSWWGGPLAGPCRPSNQGPGKGGHDHQGKGHGHHGVPIPAPTPPPPLAPTATTAPRRRRRRKTARNLARS